MPMPESARRQAGFTLIEMLVVIGILSVLAIAFLPNILGAEKEKERTETLMRITDLQMKIETFERKHGFYPPDDFTNPTPAKSTYENLKIKDNAINRGIESLVVYLAQRNYGGDAIADKSDWLDNTDGDKNSSPIPKLDSRDIVEVVDAWGTPLAYFASDWGGYATPQRILNAEGEEQRVSALRRDNGKYRAPGKFQIISAGPDLEFGTNDDVSYPGK